MKTIQSLAPILLVLAATAAAAPATAETPANAIEVTQGGVSGRPYTVIGEISVSVTKNAIFDSRLETQAAKALRAKAAAMHADAVINVIYDTTGFDIVQLNLGHMNAKGTAIAYGNHPELAAAVDATKEQAKAAAANKASGFVPAAPSAPAATGTAGTETALPAKPRPVGTAKPNEIVITESDITNRRYVAIGDITVSVRKNAVFDSSLEKKALAALREKAAAVHADAVVLVRYDTNNFDIYNFNLGHMNATGRAVVFETP